jgi:hypothetical protein
MSIENQPVTLSQAELEILTFALDLAQEEMWVRDGFTEEEQDTLSSLRARFLRMREVT